MRNYLSALAIAAAAVMTVMAAEKPPEAHVKLMKDTNATATALRGHVQAKDYDAIAADAATLKEAREVHLEAAKAIRALIPIAHEGREQRKRLLWAASVGLLSGCLLWATIPGVILRAVPTGWHMPENMAAHIVGEPALWDAGARMMRAGDPQAWRTLVAAIEIWRENRNALDTCTQKARKSEQPVPCTIHISGGMSGRSSTSRR